MVKLEIEMKDEEKKAITIQHGPNEIKTYTEN